MAQIIKCSRQDAKCIIEVCDAIINISDADNDLFLDDLAQAGTHYYGSITVTVTDKLLTVNTGHVSLVYDVEDAKMYESYTDFMYGFGLNIVYEMQYRYNDAGEENFASVYDWKQWAEQWV